MARVGRRRKRHHGRALLVIPGGAVILIVLLMALHDYHQRRAPIADPQNVTASYDDRDLSRRPLGFSQQSRVIYPYSVISGGAHTLTELQAAEVNDSVVRKHYADFDHARFRIIRLSEEKRSYVSYRLGNEVFWTKKKLRLRAGEELMTDGVYYARTRCGNRLSDVPQAKTSPRQPQVALLETPVPEELPPAVELAELPPGLYLPPAPGSWETSVPPAASGAALPPFPLILGRKPPEAPSPVPEPGSLWLLCSALGMFALFMKKFNKKRRQ